MEIPVTTTTILFIVAIGSVIFNIYHYFKKPQDRQEIDTVKLADKVATLEKEMLEMRQTHITMLEKDVKELNGTIQKLTITVTQLSTVIDERIPKASIVK